MKTIIVCGILLLQGCGQLVNTPAIVCDKIKTAQPILNSVNETDETVVETTHKSNDQTLLLYRMLNTL